MSSNNMIVLAIVLVSGIAFLAEKKSASRTVILTLLAIGVFIVAHCIEMLGLFDLPEEHSIASLEFLSTKQGALATGPEEIIYYNEEYLIVVSNDSLLMWEIGIFSNAPDGGIFVVRNHRTASPELIQMKIVGFPSGLKFHPHGSYIRHEDQRLFVVNHSYSSGGGDRVEVFKFDINTFTITYDYSILFPKEFTGVLNGLIVLQKGKMLVTKYLSTEDPLEGRQTKSILLQLQYIYHYFASVKLTHAYSCTFDEDQAQELSPQQPECQLEPQTASTMANGLTWDRKQTVYISDSSEKTVKSYRLGKGGLIKTGEIALSFSPDNIEYDSSTGSIYTAGPIRTVDHAKYVLKCKAANGHLKEMEDYWCGAGKIDSKTLSFEEVAAQKGSLVSCSSAFISDKNLFIGSWSANSVAHITLNHELVK